MHTEDFLWLTIATGQAIVCYRDWQCWMLLFESMLCFLFATFDPATFTISLSRMKSMRWSPQKHQQREHMTHLAGVQMGVVLVPSLLQTMAIHCSRNEHCNINQECSQSSSTWNRYSKIATILSIIPQTSVSSGCLLFIILFFDPSILSIDTVTTASLPIYIACVAILFFPVVTKKNNSTKSFTFGELRVVSLLLLVIILEYFRLITSPLPIAQIGSHADSATTATISSLYSLVALAGSLSCCAFAYAGSSPYIRRKFSWWWRVGLNIVGPLLAIDLSLYLYLDITRTTTTAETIIGSSTKVSFILYLVPLSLRWLIKFLIERENGYMRLWGLLYWLIVLVLTSFPTYLLSSEQSAPTGGNENRTRDKVPVVVTRKWFHLIAVLLFGPITWQFPQLMSLSYAIATCALIVLETLRNDAPLLQSFYSTFLDDNKDHRDDVIISHIFLIVGCAAPLWINQVVFTRNHVLLTEFGIICVGVGDAMGAIVGKSIGKHHWGMNCRTIEGSIAMWSSMIVIGMFACMSMQEYFILFAATTFTTILEAFTVQLDNLVLPLSGSTIILLLVRYS